MTRLRKRHVALAAFAVWVAYWSYRYWARPIPDEEIIGVVALLVAIYPAALLACVAALWWLARFLVRRMG